MSNPSNVLSDFQTYSYHHMLLMCDGIETVDMLSDSTDLSVFRRDTKNQRDVNTKYLPKYVDNNSNRGYVVLIDTMVDVAISLKSAKWETIISPVHEGETESGQRYGNTIEVDGELQIVEPYGLDFYQILANAATNLQKDPSGVVFMLKTIFIGRKSDGTQEVISNVRPFNFVMIDITSEIDISGTTYTVTLVGASNGVSKLPQHASSAQKMNIPISSSDSVGRAVYKFEKLLNTKYQKYKDKTFEAIVKNSKGTSNEQSVASLNSKFQEVEYTFAVDPVYNDNTIYKLGTADGAAIEAGKGHKNLSTGPGGTIESTLTKIMQSCAQVVADGKAENPENIKYLFKIVSSVLPSTTGKYRIHHEIQRYTLITQDQNGNPIQPGPGEFIEFDYMYTGKNVDVLKFDMKVDMGLAFYMTLANSPNLKHSQTDTTKGLRDASVVSSRPTPLIKSPLFMSTSIDDPLVRNKIDPLSQASYEAAFARHASLEHVEASIEIAGNPNLLDELIQTDGADAKIPVEGNTGASNITRTPAFIKVNVLFPANNDLIGLKDFWYQGFYNIYAIEQNFNEGLFTQNIQMLSIPLEEVGTAAKNSYTATPYKKSVVTQPSVKVTGPVCTHTQYDYNLIRGFTGNEHADNDEFVQQVELIAAQIGTLPEWLMAVMSFETGGSFSPGVKNSQSSATGLIQFISQTAIDHGTTTAALREMTALQQLYYVRSFFLDFVRRGNEMNTLEAVYTSVLAGRTYSDVNQVLFASGSAAYAVNTALDYNGDGSVTVGEAVSFGPAKHMVPHERDIVSKLKASPYVSQTAKDALRASVNNNMLIAVAEHQQGAGLTVTGYLCDEVIRDLFGMEQPTEGLCVETSPSDVFLGEDYPQSQRNHNPLNIKQTIPLAGWHGQVMSDDAFAKFTSPQYGLRAAFFLLRRTYFTTHNLTTVDQIINRWAPVEDNSKAEVTNYINYVSAKLNVSPTETLQIDWNDSQLIAMAKAMAEVEGGAAFKPYPEGTYEEGLALL